MLKAIKISIFVLVVTVSAIILSGCNLIVKSSKTSDGGVYKTTDFGSNWQQKSFLANNQDGNKTIGNVDTNFMVFDPIDENTIYLVTQGNGIFKTIDSAEQWYQTTLNTGTYISLSIDSQNNNVAYVTDGKNVNKTVNNWKTWKPIYIENRPTQSIKTVISDYFNPSVVYVATSTGLIKSFDYGKHWELLDWNKIGIRNMYQSYINKNILFILANDGIYKTSDGAQSWTKISKDLSEFPGGDKISWMFFDPHTEYIILGTQYGIIRSMNNGDSWESVPTLFKFNKITIKPVVYNPNNPNEYLFAVGNILHKSNDGGATWQTLNSIPTSRIVNYIIADPYHDDVVYVGTYLPKK